MLAHAAVLLSLASGVVRPPAADTATLAVGDPSIDGRYLTPHLAAMIVTLTRGHDTVSARTYTLDKVVARMDGRRVFRLVLRAPVDAPDPAYYVESILDWRTMAILHRQERDGTGRSVVYDVDGARVTGSIQTSRGAPRESIDVRLVQPSFLSVFMDAAINAASPRQGRVYRVPAFDITARRTEWHTFRVTQRDRLVTHGHAVLAWVIEEGSTVRSTRRRIWLTKEPPFFPLDITDLRDGSVRRIEQTLVRVHS